MALTEELKKQIYDIIRKIASQYSANMPEMEVYDRNQLAIILDSIISNSSGLINLVGISSTFAGLPDATSVDNTGKVAFLSSDDGLNDAGFYISNGTVWQYSNIDITAIPMGRDPLNSDDGSSGYMLGQTWINTSSGDVFISTDVSNGSAIWLKVQEDGNTKINRWKKNTDYRVGDLVRHPQRDTTIIEVTSTRTSGASFDSTEAFEWKFFGQLTSYTTFAVGQYYYIGEIISHDMNLYRCISNNLSTTSSPSSLIGTNWDWDRSQSAMRIFPSLANNFNLDSDPEQAFNYTRRIREGAEISGTGLPDGMITGASTADESIFIWETTDESSSNGVATFKQWDDNRIYREWKRSRTNGTWGAWSNITSIEVTEHLAIVTNDTVPNISDTPINTNTAKFYVNGLMDVTGAFTLNANSTVTFVPATLGYSLLAGDDIVTVTYHK